LVLFKSRWRARAKGEKGQEIGGVIVLEEKDKTKKGKGFESVKEAADKLNAEYNISAGGGGGRRIEKRKPDPSANQKQEINSQKKLGGTGGT